MTTLRAQRLILSDAEYNSYNPDAFPGSRAWKANNIAAQALAAFDAEHPEIIAEIKAEQAAARAAKYAAMSDFVKMGS